MAWLTRLADPASPDDLDELVRLRRVMFESMGIDCTDRSWESVCRGRLAERLDGPDASTVAVVVDHPAAGRAGLVASGIYELQLGLAGPTNPAGRRAYISSVSVDPAFRRRGLARAVMGHLGAELTRRGIDRVELHATPDGRRLYEQLGFRDRPGGAEMQLVRAEGGPPG